MENDLKKVEGTDGTELPLLFVDLKSCSLEKLRNNKDLLALAHLSDSESEGLEQEFFHYDLGPIRRRKQDSLKTSNDGPYDSVGSTKIDFLILETLMSKLELE